MLRARSKHLSIGALITVCNLMSVRHLCSGVELKLISVRVFGFSGVSVRLFRAILITGEIKALCRDQLLHPLHKLRCRVSAFGLLLAADADVHRARLSFLFSNHQQEWHLL